MSLRYRITLTIFLLELVMVIVVLSQSLTLFRDHSRQVLESTENATIGLLGNFARAALLTEDYESFRPHIDEARISEHIDDVVLSGISGKILAASTPGDVGQPAQNIVSTDQQWRTHDITNATGLIGTLSIKFSDKALITAYHQARNHGIIFAGLGMLVIAAVGLAMGYILTARLARLVDVAQRLGQGNHSARAHLSGRDEVAVLGNVIDTMAAQIEIDRTELEQLNRSLAHRVANRTQDLTKALKEMESFSYSVSHDLRAPLRGINGFCAILDEDYKATLEPQARDYLHRIREATQRMDELIDDLLVLARISQTLPQSQDIDMTAICRACLQELSATEDQHSLEISIQEGMRAQADPHLIRPLFNNLLQNAVKYSCHSQPAIISVGSTQHNGVETYYVRDNGIGIEMDKAQRIFEPFQRLHNRSEYEGTGIGLAIAHRIVDLHHGKIWAESVVGKGTTFYFTLTTDNADFRTE